MSTPKQFCIEPDADATWTFGQHVAINDKYLVFTDSLRNKVTVYIPDNSGGWQKAREILPPADLDLGQISSGSAFGSGIELDGDVLAISAITLNPGWVKKESKQFKRDGIPKYAYWRYLTNLETQTPLKQIDLLVEPESDRVRFNLLRGGKIEQFILPNMGKKIFGDNGLGFGSSVALDENLLLVSYLSEDRTGGAYLFDLARPKAEPLKLAVEDTALGSTIAVSQQFAAVGFDGIRWQFATGSRGRSFMTLIRNLENGVTSIVKSFGKVSLSGNILAVMHPYHYEAAKVFLELYRLDENANAHLIKKQTVYRGEVQNGFLFTRKDSNPKRVCIEPLPKN